MPLSLRSLEAEHSDTLISRRMIGAFLANRRAGFTINNMVLQALFACSTRRTLGSAMSVGFGEVESCK